MPKYINKDKVIEELKKRIEKYKILHSNSQLNLSKIALKENIVEYYNFLSFLDTLEVKEVDLEKHLKEDIENVYFDLNGVAVKGATYYLTVEDIKEIAKHFYELGLKAQKGE